MIYPVGTGTKADFDLNWKIDTQFGAATTYGFHEGVDINLKTGGDSDLGQNLLAIAPGRILYYHYNAHPTTNFGRHIVYKITGAWGTRWVHYAHCLDTGFTNSVVDVAEGQVIAKLGKSGNSQYAHLHMAIFKVDPIGVGIDNIANTQQELNDTYENPLAFINQWITAPTPAPDNYKVLYEQALITIESKNNRIVQLETQINDFNNRINRFKEDTKNYVGNYQV